MIEDREIGLKIAESPEEKFWQDMKKKCEDMLKQCEHEIIIQNAIKALSDEKLKVFSKA